MSISIIKQPDPPFFFYPRRRAAGAHAQAQARAPLGPRPSAPVPAPSALALAPAPPRVAGSSFGPAPVTYPSLWQFIYLMGKNTNVH